jgi:hypothetical protein
MRKENRKLLRYAPCPLLFAVGYGTQNALKVVINFCFWYIECNLGGEDGKFLNRFAQKAYSHIGNGLLFFKISYRRFLCQRLHLLKI